MHRTGIHQRHRDVVGPIDDTSAATSSGSPARRSRGSKYRNRACSTLPDAPGSLPPSIRFTSVSVATGVNRCAPSEGRVSAVDSSARIPATRRRSRSKSPANAFAG